MKQYRKLITLFAAIFILIESAAVFYAVQSSSNDSENIFKPIQVVRLGILPDVSQKYSHNYWRSFIAQFKDEEDGFIIETYIAHTYSELLSGFVNGSLDLIYVNPATYHQLESEHELVPIASERLTEGDMDKNRCVLVTNKEVEFLNQTKGLRLTFVDKFSLSGYIVPYNSLMKSLSPNTISEWFSEISYAPTKSQAFINMINDETDIIATDRLALMRIIDYLQCSDSGFTELWLSRMMPEALLCCFKTFSDKNIAVMTAINNVILKHSQKMKQVDSAKIAFAPIENSYTYQERLSGLKKYIDNLKFGQKRSNVLMGIGGE